MFLGGLAWSRMARIRCPWCPSRCPAPAVSQSGELSAAWNSKHRESLREFLRESQMLQKAYEAYMFCLFGIVLSCFVMRHAALHRSEALGVHLCSLPLPYRAQLQLAKSTPQKKMHAAWTNSMKHKEFLPWSWRPAKYKAPLFSFHCTKPCKLRYVMLACWNSTHFDTFFRCSFSTPWTPQCPGLNWLRQWFGRICRLPTLKPIAFRKEMSWRRMLGGQGGDCWDTTCTKLWCWLEFSLPDPFAHGCKIPWGFLCSDVSFKISKPFFTTSADLVASWNICQIVCGGGSRWIIANWRDSETPISQGLELLMQPSLLPRA